MRALWSRVRHVRDTAFGQRVRPLYELANRLSGYRLSDDNPLCTYLKYATTPDQLAARVRTLAQRTRRDREASVHALNYVSNLLPREDRDTARTLVEQALNGLPCGTAGAALTEYAERMGVDLPASFRVSIAMRSRKKRFHALSEWALSGKEAAYAFADRLQVPHPRVLARHVPFAELRPDRPMVIKPVRGSDSKGVYLYFDADRIFDVHYGRMLSGWDEVRERVRETFDTGLLRFDNWLAEELVLNADGTPAHDLKCMTFYGHTALVLEVARYPGVAKRWLTRDGEDIEPGITRTRLSGRQDALAEAVALAERISTEIPAPFMRIDLLTGRDGLRFGEFTPRPGWFHMFDDDADRWLGDLFLDAEERLIRDLLDGKPFAAYKAHLRDHKPPAQAGAGNPGAAGATPSAATASSR
jgi:hypothetical protein